MDETKNTNHTNRMVKLAVEIAFIFAIPAIVVGLFGPKLDSIMGTEKMWSIVLLLGALVLSWSIVIARYKKASGEIRQKKAERAEKIQ